MSSSPTSTRSSRSRCRRWACRSPRAPIVEWKKAVGDWIEADEPIVEISTDKVETEIPSPASGRGGSRFWSSPGRPWTWVWCSPASRSQVAGRRSQTPDRPSPRRAGCRQRALALRNGGPPISPVVRRMADEHDIDLSLVSGSGRLGRVTKRDVLAFLDDSTVERAPAPAPTLHSESPTSRNQPLRPATCDLRPRGRSSSR